MNMLRRWSSGLDAIIHGTSMRALFLRYFLIFFLLLFSLASYAMFRIIAVQSNPFFYANF